MSVTLKSSIAIGKFSFFRHAKFVRLTVGEAAKRFGIRVYEFSINGNHLHFVLRATNRPGYRAFIRTVTGQIAMKVTGTKRGRGKHFKFWDSIPYTRILQWGKDFRQACRYVIQNILEAEGVIPYQPRGRRFKAAPA